MNQYSLCDVAEALGIDIETLFQWLALDHNTPVSRDTVSLRFDHEQVESLARSHGIALSPTDAATRVAEGHLPTVQDHPSIRVDALDLTRTTREHTLLLHDVSLTIPAGAFVALVGGSGVGKSTLMYALSGIQPAPQGTVLYNGHNYYDALSTFSNEIGYVPQDDILHRRLSVRRALYYAARMRLPAYTAAQIKGRIQEVLLHGAPRIHGWRLFLLLSLRYLELLKNDTGNLLLLLLQAPIIGLILFYLAGQGTFDPTSIVQCPTRANILSRTGPIVSIDCQRVVNLLNSPQGAAVARQRGETKSEVFHNAIMPNSGVDSQKVLFIMAFAAILLGCINGVREIVKELPIYQRERLVNVGLTPYLFSKIVILGVLSLLQSAILIVLVNAKALIQQGIFLPPIVEISISMALTALAGLMLGLAISAFAPNTDRAMSFVPLVLLPQVIFSGMLFKLDTPLLQAVGSIFAMRWSMAAMGSSVGLHADKLGVDSFAYQGTLFTSLNPGSTTTSATIHLLLVWGILLVMILVLTGLTAFFLYRKDIRREVRA